MCSGGKCEPELDSCSSRAGIEKCEKKNNKLDKLEDKAQMRPFFRTILFFFFGGGGEGAINIGAIRARLEPIPSTFGKLDFAVVPDGTFKLTSATKLGLKHVMEHVIRINVAIFFPVSLLRS